MEFSTMKKHILDNSRHFIRLKKKIKKLICFLKIIFRHSLMLQ